MVTHAPSIHDNSHLFKTGGHTGVRHCSTERDTEVHNRRPYPCARIKRLIGKRDLSALVTDEPLHQYTHDPLLLFLDHYCKLLFFYIIPRKFPSTVRAGSTLIKQNPVAQYERCEDKIGKQWGYSAFFQDSIPRSRKVWKSSHWYTFPCAIGVVIFPLDAYKPTSVHQFLQKLQNPYMVFWSIFG